MGNLIQLSWENERTEALMQARLTGPTGAAESASHDSRGIVDAVVHIRGVGGVRRTGPSRSQQLLKTNSD